MRSPLAQPLCLVLVSTSLMAAAHADVLSVPAEFPTIRAAMDAASTGDVVEVADGVWIGEGNRDLDFSGKDIVVRSQNGPANCIIDCQGSFADPHRGFLLVSGETRAAKVRGFTIRNGSTEQGAILNQFNGGAILIDQASPTIEHCVFQNNVSGCWGGAVFSGGFHQNGAQPDWSPLIARCRFEDNFSGDDGGGFFSWGDVAPVLVNTSFQDNSAVARGGAIAVFSGSITLVNTTVVENHAPTGGGAVLWGDTVIANSIVWSNTGSSSQLDYNAHNDFIVTHSNVMGGVPGFGNLDVDPVFGADGVHLAAHSPCIDAGLAHPLAMQHRDIDGQSRSLHGHVDMGADEFVTFVPPGGTDGQSSPPRSTTRRFR